MTAPTSKSDRRSVETRARLLSAASELIAERGWASVSTRDVAARAGVNPALVNYHFGGKSQLLIAGAIESLQTLAGELEPVFAATSLDQLVEAALAFVQRTARSQAVRVMLEATLQAPLDPVVGGMVGVQIRAFRELIATQVRATPRFADPEAVALVVAAALDGLLLHALAEPGTDLARAAEGFRELLRAGDVAKP